MISFVNPRTQNPLIRIGDDLVDSQTGEVVATYIKGIPRFVSVQENYAENFGRQWKRWRNLLSDSRNPKAAHQKRKEIIQRTRFDQLNLQGKTILECGCGGGDDTEILLEFPFSEIHSFDLSSAVERAREVLPQDSRLVLSQASIFDIPYPDEAFDIVFCHRVLQHTPSPKLALRKIARKVKPGGILFVHSYHWTFRYLMHYKYKYRWLTKRMPPTFIENFIDQYGERLYSVAKVMRMHPNALIRFLAFSFLPFEFRKERYGEFTDTEMIEWCKHATFDALTPKYDKPMRWRTMKRILSSEGFEILWFHAPLHASAIWCTARKRKA